LLKQYAEVLILTGYDIEQVTTQALATERAAFAAGYPFALAVAVTLCSACEGCTFPEAPCRHGNELRPESAVAGIHTLETLRRLGISADPDQGWLRASFVFLG
jgi:predicted metal-binding protein